MLKKLLPLALATLFSLPALAADDVSAKKVDKSKPVAAEDVNAKKADKSASIKEAIEAKLGAKVTSVSKSPTSGFTRFTPKGRSSTPTRNSA